MDRAEQLLRSLPRASSIIEIGPSFRPLAPKRDGWNTLVVDHASRADLVRKYHDQAVDRIEEVDIVWTGGSLADAVPAERHGTFDAFIASHVIEHTTDLVTFLRAAETLLKPDGVVILAVPDKRKCFDLYRYPSATADAIAAFLERRDRHTLRTHVDYALNMALKSGTDGSWAGDDARPAVPANPLDGEPGWRAAAAAPDYVDAHAWVFVPASFSLMILELSLLGYLDLRVEDVLERDAVEFFVWLRRGAAALSVDAARAARAALMERVVVELAEQSRQLPDSPLSRSVPETLLRDRLLRAAYRTEAVRAVLGAVRASTGLLGLNRLAFRRRVAEAGRKVPGSAPAAVLHHTLLTEARRVLDGRTRPVLAPDEIVEAEVEGSGALLVVPLSAAQFGSHLAAEALARERQRVRVLRLIIDALLVCLRPGALNGKTFKATIAQAALTIPRTGSETAQHGLLLAEVETILGNSPRQRGPSSAP